MKLKEVLDKTIQFFKEKKIENARLEAEWLIAGGLKLDRIQMYMKYDQPLKDHELQILRDMVKRRISGEPLAYITGSKGFYGLEFKVTPAVLIPRPETETLVEKALDWLKTQTQDEIHVLDLGSGSGCIGLTLAKKDSRIKVRLVDISLEALEVAQENTKLLKLEERTTFTNQDAADFLKTTDEKFDLIVANPPYINPHDSHVEENVKKYEPHLALYADEGSALLEQWSKLAVHKMKQPGFMLMEMGFDQGQEMKNYFESLRAFTNTQVIQDLSSKDRVITGEIHG